MPSPEGGRLAGVRDGVSSVMFMTVRKQSEVGARQGGGSMEEKIGRCLTCTPPGVGSPVIGHMASWPAAEAVPSSATPPWTFLHQPTHANASFCTPDSV
jgi:hypothetical protein